MTLRNNDNKTILEANDKHSTLFDTRLEVIEKKNARNNNIISR